MLVFPAICVYGQTAAGRSVSSRAVAVAATTDNEGSNTTAETVNAAASPASESQEASAAQDKTSAAAPAPANQENQAACPRLAVSAIPLNETIEASVQGLLDSGHLKPGKEIWVKVGYGIAFPECSLDADAAIYGHVMAVTSTKNPNASELSLQFDHADCTGHPKKELNLWLIGVLASPDDSDTMHEAVPAEVAGGSRRISTTVGNTSDFDERLNPGGPPHTVLPGIVVGMKKVKLMPGGGAPGCGAKITSTDRSVHLGPGTELILTIGRAQ